MSHPGDRYLDMEGRAGDSDVHLALHMTEKGYRTFRRMQELYGGSGLIRHPSLLVLQASLSLFELLDDYRNEDYLVTLGELQFEMSELGNVPYSVTETAAQRLIKSGDLKAINLN